MNRIHEQLSALMDGELEHDQTRFLLKRLGADRELPQRWARYHLVRQTLRRQELAVLPDFAEAVMLRLEVEPAHARAALPIWLRWGAGGAIAASVAVAALIVTRPADDIGPAPSAVAGAVPRGAPANAMPVAATATSGEFRAPLLPLNAPIEAAPASFGTDSAPPVAADPYLQSYLIRHYQAVGGAGQSAFVPYVLLVPQREAAVQSQPNTSAPRNH